MIAASKRWGSTTARSWTWDNRLTERRPRRKPGENRARLLKAGLVEFGLFGYHGASTASIAARADVPQPHVYTSFRTKQELFLACLVEAVGQLVEGSSATAVESHSRVQEPMLESAALYALIYQAVAVAQDEAMRESIVSQIIALREALGERGVAELLEIATTVLLPAPSAQAKV